MIAKRRVVLDTNTLLSGILKPGSTPAHAVTKAFRSDTVLCSRESRFEILLVLQREKFDRYLSKERRLAYFERVLPLFEPVKTTLTINMCRDTSDNKILELAISGKADIIITGDRDLLVLHPFRGVSILSPADYLALT